MAIRRIFKMVRLVYIGLGDWPTGLEPPAGARNRRKVTVKNTTNEKSSRFTRSRTDGQAKKLNYIVVSQTKITLLRSCGRRKTRPASVSPWPGSTPQD